MFFFLGSAAIRIATEQKTEKKLFFLRLCFSEKAREQTERTKKNTMMLLQRLLALALLLFVGLNLNGVHGQDQTRFMAPGVTVQETDRNTGETIRQYTTTLFYSDEYGTGNGREAVRLLSAFPNSNLTHNDLRIYEDQFLRFTFCSGTLECGWEDLFPDQLPMMWCPSSGAGGTTPASQSVNGVPASQLIEFTTATNHGIMLTWCRTDSSNEVVAVFEPQASVNVLYLFQQGSIDTDPTAFNDTIFSPPAICPVVDASCFRLDLMFVLDHSGSIGESWTLITQFTADLIEQLSISEQDFQVGVNRFFGGGSCTVPLVGNYTVFISGLTTDKTALLDIMRSPATSQLGPPCLGGCPGGSCNTATVKGITLAMDELETNGRPATNKAIVVITDGNGNRPCDGLGGGRVITDLTFSPNEWIYDIDDTGGANPCADRHDDWLCVAYRQKWNTTQPTVYAVGVPDNPTVIATCGGGGPSCGTLNRIALNDGSDCPGWWPDAQQCCSVGTLENSETRDRAILVDSYDSLGEVTFSLAKALTCPNPGATPCPNDCRPGGFCCGGTCICLEDCTTSHPGDSCQIGVCATTSSGTQCVAVGSTCSSEDDPTGIIVGSVIGALVACCCLLGLLALASVLVLLFYRKSTKDIQAWEEAFAKDQQTHSSPLFVEKNTSVTSALYDGGD